MTSKNLFFKLSYEDLKGRLWTFALVMLTFLFLFPVSIVYRAGEYHGVYESLHQWVAWYESEIIELIDPTNGFLCFLIIVMAVVCGMTSFSYLNFKNKVDFFHSIPVRREKLYLANFLNGIWLVALPYAVMLTAGIAIGASNGADFLTLAGAGAKGYAFHMTYYLLTYSTVVVVMMLTGNRVVGFMGTLVFFSYVPLATSMAEGCFYIWFDTYYATSHPLRELLMRFSPVITYIVSIDEFAYGDFGVGGMLAALAMFFLLAAIGLILYRKRPSEAAGKAIAFRCSKPVIRILLVLLCSVSMGAFGWNLRESMGWAVFFLLCGSIISHCVIEIIFNFDFKKLFNHKFQLLGCIAVSLAILCIFRYDLLGYDKYLPAAEKVESSAVYLGNVDTWVNYGTIEQNEDGGYDWKSESGREYQFEHMKLTDTQAVLDMAEAGIEKNELLKQVKNSKGTIQEELLDDYTGELYSDVYIKYRLKSGKEVYRKYELMLDQEAELLNRIYSSREYKEGCYPILSQNPDEFQAVFYKKTKNDGQVQKAYQLSKEQLEKLYNAFINDWQSLTIEQRESQEPVGTLRFLTKDGASAIGWADRKLMLEESAYRYRTVQQVEFYPVYPSFKKTLELLAEYGVDTKDVLEGYEVSSITISDYSRGDEHNFTVSDPAQLEEIMRNVVLVECAEFDTFIPIDYNIKVTVVFEREGVLRDHGFLFKKNQIPEFVTEKLGMENGRDE